MAQIYLSRLPLVHWLGCGGWGARGGFIVIIMQILVQIGLCTTPGSDIGRGRRAGQRIGSPITSQWTVIQPSVVGIYSCT